jgi:catalase
VPGRKDNGARDASPDEKQAQLEGHRVRHEGTWLTTDQGIAVDDTNNSLRVGERGPTLLEDFHFREKITRFDHERIPERVVHARGAGAYGYFECTDSLADVTRAHLFAEEGRRTPVFVRFSTVAGSRGSADTVRDVRGFATKFYTAEGNFDLVANNMPVFFIQDAIKFPDFVHAVKPEPHNEIPQASSAHDTLWDFVSLQPEATHMMMWLMSDRALPRSYRMMQGFGVHTFRFVDAAGHGTFVKFHWRPVLGTHSLVWDETQKIAGKDPDFNRRDLWDAIAAGQYPQYELGVQLVPETDEHRFDFDLLDPTKIIPEEEVPLRVVGRLVLDRNPDNFFAETEQVAFHVANLVPGIDVTNDPLLQGRLFSYLDTQLIRLGGPNFAHLPVNRAIAPVHHHQRDGFSQHRLEVGEVAHHPNSIQDGYPANAIHDGSPAAQSLPGAGDERPENVYRHYTERVDGTKIRRRSPSFDDHYTQATLFWNSMSDWERQHIVDAFSFELGRVTRVAIRQRMVDVLGNVHPELATAVADKLGVQPAMSQSTGEASVPHGRRSPALSQATQPGTPATRTIAVLAADGVDETSLAALLEGLRAEGATPEVLAPHGGTLEGASGSAAGVDRAIDTMSSVLYDAVVVADGPGSADRLAMNGEAVHYISEAYRHAKTIGAIGHGIALLDQAPTPGAPVVDRSAGLVDAQGVITVAGRDGGVPSADDVRLFVAAFVEALARHRHFERSVALVPA